LRQVSPTTIYKQSPQINPSAFESKKIHINPDLF
jgi:hypothetical protein